MTALSGFRVLELAEGVAGEYCGKLLSDFGAEVIKLERPDGSPTRRLGPFGPAPDGADPRETSGLFAYLNTNKQSVVLEVESQAGAASLQALLGQVDAVIDDHAPGWLKSVGIDPERLAQSHPQLVVCAITPYGQSPLEDRKLAEDLNVVHASGWGYHTPSAADGTRPPLKGAGRFQASYETGVDAAMAVVAALFEREESGAGNFIDVSKQATMLSRIGYVMAQMVAGDMTLTPSRTAWDLPGPSAIFPCREGFAYLWMSDHKHWGALRQLMGDPAWARDYPEHWVRQNQTPERLAQYRQEVGAWLLTQDRDDISERAQKLGIECVPVNDASDLPRSVQYKFRKYFTEVNHPVLGKANYPTVPYKMSVTPARITSPAPMLGQHTDAVLAAPAPSSRARSMSAASRGGPLAGVRVLELTRVWAGPYAGQLLAYLGAEVIKIESLGSMDATRFDGKEGQGFRSVNPQKLSVQIDVKNEEGRALLLKLLEQTDVVIESLRPGSADRLGIGYEAVRAVNPGIIYVAMGMYGKEGPLSFQTGYAPCFVAIGGLTYMVGYEGEKPTGMNIRYADAMFGASGAMGAVMALMHKRRTGAGQLVDVSACETASSMIGDIIMDQQLTGNVQACDGARNPDMAPHGVYPCLPGEWISIAAPDDRAWRALAEALGYGRIAEHAHFRTLADRKTHEAELDRLVASWTAGRDARELTRLLQSRGVPAMKSQSTVDLVADPQLWRHGAFRMVSDPWDASRPIIGPSWRMTHEAEITRGGPALGEHNAYVLGEVLGLSEAEQQRLAEVGAAR